MLAALAAFSVPSALKTHFGHNTIRYPCVPRPVELLCHCEWSWLWRHPVQPWRSIQVGSILMHFFCLRCCPKAHEKGTSTEPMFFCRFTPWSWAATSSSSQWSDCLADSPDRWWLGGQKQILILVNQDLPHRVVFRFQSFSLQSFPVFRGPLSSSPRPWDAASL